MNWNRRSATWAGLALVVLTNAVALGGAAYNRMGEPQGTLKLGERELSPPYAWNRMTENSGLTLQLRWRSLPAAASTPRGRTVYGNDRNPGWLDARKMRELGFDANAIPTAHPFDNPFSSHRQLPRDVFVVLELDGPAYQESLRRAEAAVDPASAASAPRDASRQQAQVALESDQRTETRLFAVDAGLDGSVLRARYPDRTMYAIVRGRVSPMRDRVSDKLGGYIDGLGVDEINVPLQLRPVFEGVEPLNTFGGGKPAVHFDATVVFGQRSEPWLAAAARR